MRRRCGSGDARRHQWRSALLQVCGGGCFAFFVSLSSIPDTDLRHTTVRKNYEDETRHPSSGGTTGGAGC